MRVLLCSIITVLICVFPVFGDGSGIKAGAAKRIITPEKFLPISGGIGTPLPATQKKGDLFARVMVLEKGDTRVAIVGIDNLGWPSVLANKVRKLVPSIPPDNILIGVTHTHSAPDAYGFLLQLIQLGVIKENDIEMFIERAIAYGKDDISVDDLKSIISTILFGLDNRSSFNGYPFFQGDTTIQ